MKKVISLLLALVMALSLLPTAVWAEGEDAAAPAEEVSESFFDSSHISDYYTIFFHFLIFVLKVPKGATVFT